MDHQYIMHRWDDDCISVPQMSVVEQGMRNSTLYWHA